jgi:hypothetical protein
MIHRVIAHNTPGNYSIGLSARWRRRTSLDSVRDRLLTY